MQAWTPTEAGLQSPSPFSCPALKPSTTSPCALLSLQGSLALVITEQLRGWEVLTLQARLPPWPPGDPIISALPCSLGR